LGLAVEIIGLVMFLGAHVFVSLRNERDALISRIGGGPYRGLFALVSIVGLVLIGFRLRALPRRRSHSAVVSAGVARHIVEALMWPASVLVVAAYVPGNIKRVLKHPLLVAVKTWAVAHLCANGDLGGMILFGAVLAWAVYARITLKRRADPGAPAAAAGGHP
jgi:uncharacterized membrane protein